MAVFYSLHHILPSTESFKGGKRNCAVFMSGCIVYIVLYIIIKTLQLKHGSVMDSALPALFTLIICDMGAMAYLYREHYGRSIVHEVVVTRDTNPNWVFDEKLGKYRAPTLAEITEQKMTEQIDAHVTHGRLNCDAIRVQAKVIKDTSAVFAEIADVVDAKDAENANHPEDAKDPKDAKDAGNAGDPEEPL